MQGWELSGLSQQYACVHLRRSFENSCKGKQKPKQSTTPLRKVGCVANEEWESWDEDYHCGSMPTTYHMTLVKNGFRPGEGICAGASMHVHHHGKDAFKWHKDTPQYIQAVSNYKEVLEIYSAAICVAWKTLLNKTNLVDWPTFPDKIRQASLPQASVWRATNFLCKCFYIPNL